MLNQSTQKRAGLDLLEKPSANAPDACVAVPSDEGSVEVALGLSEPCSFVVPKLAGNQQEDIDSTVLQPSIATIVREQKKLLPERIANKIKAEIERNKNKSCPEKAFFSLISLPSLSIERFIIRFMKYFSREESVYIVMLIYLRKFLALAAEKVILDDYNVHLLLACSVLLARKICIDVEPGFEAMEFRINAHAANVFGMSLSDLNRMEREFLLVLAESSQNYLLASAPNAQIANPQGGIDCEVKQQESHKAEAQPALPMSLNRHSFLFVSVKEYEACCNELFDITPGGPS